MIVINVIIIFYNRSYKKLIFKILSFKATVKLLLSLNNTTLGEVLVILI